MPYHGHGGPDSEIFDSHVGRWKLLGHVLHIIGVSSNDPQTKSSLQSLTVKSDQGKFRKYHQQSNFTPALEGYAQIACWTTRYDEFAVLCRFK